MITLDFNTLAAWEQDLYRISQYVAYDEWSNDFQLNIPPKGSQLIYLNNLPWNCVVVNLRGLGSGGELNAACTMGLAFYGSARNSGTDYDLTFSATRNPYFETYADNYDAVITLTNISNLFNVNTTNPTIRGTIKFGRTCLIKRSLYSLVRDS